MEAERRIDPEDGKARTFDELVQHYKSVYTFHEVQQYWDNRCRQDIPTDPFLTSLQQPGPEFKLRPDHEPPTEPASQVNLGPVKLSEDPFLAASFNQQAKHPPALHQVNQPEVGTKDSQHWSETISTCLGAGDVNRQPRARTTLIMVPIFLFIWELLVWSLVSHISRNGCWLIMITLFIVSAAAIGMWFQGIRWGPVSLAALGVLCMLAIAGGTALGQRGWDQLWRQFFWMNTGNQLVPTFAGTAAAARSDAATLTFGSAAGSLDHSSVDASRSVGFKDTNLFCVAPVLSPDTAGADFPRVNFWAVGMDCCTKSGVFDCDASRDYDAMQAVVQLGGGYPCPSCNVETFQKAIAKAEATYGLVSAPDALLIRWVTNTNKVKFQAAGWAIGYLLLCSLMGSGFLFILGWMSWYYGLGKRAPSGNPWPIIRHTGPAIREREAATVRQSGLHSLMRTQVLNLQTLMGHACKDSNLSEGFK